MPTASPPPLRPDPPAAPGIRGLASFDRALLLVDLDAALAARLGRPAEALRGLALAEALPAWAPALEPAARQVVESAAPAIDLVLPGGGAVASLYPVLARGGALLGVDLVVGAGAVALAPCPPPPWPEAVGEGVEPEERLRRLQAMTESFAAAQTRAQVRRVVVEDAARAMGAARVGFRVLGPRGLTLDEFLLYGDADPEVIRRAGLVPLEASHPAAEAARSGAPVFLRDGSDLARRYPELAAQQSGDPVEASAHLPLKGGEGLFGVLTFGFAGPRLWDEGERTFALALAGRAAVAYERARLFEAERAAREQSERLQAVTARLATALTPADVVAAVLEEGLPALGSTLGSVVRREGDELVVEGMVGFPEAASRRWSRFPLAADTPIAEAVRAGEGIWLERPEEFERRYGRPVDPAARALAQASLALPMVAYGRVIGALGVSYPEPRSFDPESRRFAETLADLCAQALERSRLFEAEREARRLVEEASRLKDEFLATVSHELRTPLTAFLGYAHLLRSRPRDEAYIARTVERMVQSAQAQAQLIDDLLDIARIVNGRLRIEPLPIDLAPVIHAAIDTVRPAAEARGLALTVDLRPGVGAVVGDAGRLQQVFWNLLTNAVKFTAPGGAIAVRLERDGGEAVVAVSDTGRGIDPDFLPFVFDRFRQADSTASRPHGGLGLGLSIVRHLVELHGGTVEAASAGPWEGATFTVRLPLAAGPSAAQPAGAAGREGPPELRGLRVLLVDDQPAILELLHEVFAPYGAHVRAFASAREALAALRTSPPDVLVSDIAMPEEDGYWLIERVRALRPEEGGAVPAVALTAYVRAEDRLRVLAAGFQQYVPKPVEPAELSAVVARLVGAAPPARAGGDGE